MQNEPSDSTQMQSDTVKENKNEKINGNVNKNVYGYEYGNGITYNPYSNKEQKARQGNFDPMEVFKKALARSYPNENADETVKEYYR